MKRLHFTSKRKNQLSYYFLLQPYYSRDGSVEATPLGSLTGVNQATPPPPPPGIPYNSVAAGRIAASSSSTNTSSPVTSPAANVVNAKTTVIATRPSANNSGAVQLVQLVTSTSTQPNSTSAQDDDAGSTISSQNEDMYLQAHVMLALKLIEYVLVDHWLLAEPFAFRQFLGLVTLVESISKDWFTYQL
ncbi:unnamed protein product [Cylicostephanus goldi]|uniref:Uncharacterized protein n=1 Tax=Cylicostephanus goldi TaxID=71465 RepID=A0A3P7NRB6_CYLGO|nr:unnamed protein product [Cylicostephanus goldi]